MSRQGTEVLLADEGFFAWAERLARREARVSTTDSPAGPDGWVSGSVAAATPSTGSADATAPDDALGSGTVAVGSAGFVGVSD